MSNDKKNPQNIAYHIRGTFRAFETALNRHLLSIDMPLSYFHVLRIKWDKSGLSQKQIATQSFMSESVASQVVQNMERVGLIIREPDPDDGRQKIVFLTPDGRRKRTGVLKSAMDIVTTVSNTVSKADAETTIAVLVELRENLEELNDS